MTKETADKLGLTKISDLEGKSEDLTLYGTPECRQRLDCLLGLQEVYGLKFKKFVPVDTALRHEVLSKGQADVSIVFTTDPQIKREGFVLLEDDKGMFPPYNSTLVVRDDVIDKAGPDLQKTVEPGQQGPDRRGDAGAERARGPRQADARRTSPASTWRSPGWSRASSQPYKDGWSPSGEINPCAPGRAGCLRPPRARPPSSSRRGGRGSYMAVSWSRSRPARCACSRQARRRGSTSRQKMSAWTYPGQSEHGRPAAAARPARLRGLGLILRATQASRCSRCCLPEVRLYAIRIAMNSV